MTKQTKGLNFPAHLFQFLFPDFAELETSATLLSTWCRTADLSLAIFDLDLLELDWILNRLSDYKWIKGGGEQHFNLKEFVHPQDLERVLDDIQHFRRFKHENYETVYRLKDFQGNWNWDLVRSLPFKHDRQGVCTHSLLIIRHLNLALNHSRLVNHLNEEQRQSKRRMLDRILTTREKEVLELIAKAKTDEEIANNLMISIKTVATHRQNLLHKLNARSKLELIRSAVAYGIKL